MGALPWKWSHAHIHIWIVCIACMTKSKTSVTLLLAVVYIFARHMLQTSVGVTGYSGNRMRHFNKHIHSHTCHVFNCHELGKQLPHVVSLTTPNLSATSVCSIAMSFALPAYHGCATTVRSGVACFHARHYNPWYVAREGYAKRVQGRARMVRTSTIIAVVCRLPGHTL